jgi:two-component system NtrC family sensor kinase
MVVRIFRWIGDFPHRWIAMDEAAEPAERYHQLRRKLVVLMAVVTLLPLLLMAMVNYFQYQRALRGEIVQPLRILANKTKHSFELYLAERRSAVNFIASAYSYEELADERTLTRIYSVAKKEFKGFVDLGLIDDNGLQVSYVGPYDLKKKQYAEQSWFHEVQVRGVYISDVFMGYRKFPHLVIAVLHITESGEKWILRTTIETQVFDELIASMRLDPESDAFLINRDGVLQTRSKFYGDVLQKIPFQIEPVTFETNIIEKEGPEGHEVFLAYTYFVDSPFALVVVKPKADVLQAWYTLKSELVFIFLGSVVLIFLVVLKLTDLLIRRIKEADEKREVAFREMQHTHKLSSIGRLATGVAHEINNPMAIINEKAGLLKDLTEFAENFPQREAFLRHIQAIMQSVERCRAITHRLLGFARRMDVQVEVLDLNEVIKEVLSFLEKEALYRNIQVRLQLAENLPRIASDRGQLQQVFLNILNNAIAAVEDGGMITLTTWEEDLDTVAASIQDNGCGMSEETLNNIFEPFFTTKREYGTGLGLSITYGIVKRLGGDIKVRSKEKAGTTFMVYLPKKPREGTVG